MAPPSPLLEDFRLHLTVERNLSPHTARNYLLDLQALEEHLVRHGSELLQATPTDIDAHLAHLAGRLAPTSRARHVSSIKSFYRFLVREHRLETSPAKWATRPSVRHRKEKPILEVAEVSAVLEQPPADTVLGLRDRAMLELLYGAGLRAGELASLDDGGVDGAARTLLVRGKGGKERLCPINRQALKALAAYLERRSELRARGKEQDPDAVFLGRWGKRMTPVQIFVRVRKAAAACGFTLSPHGLRHAYATHLFEGGASSEDIQRLLGHELLETTQRYIRVRLPFLVEEYQRCHPRAQMEAQRTRSSAAPSGGPRTPSARSRSSGAELGRHKGRPARRTPGASRTASQARSTSVATRLKLSG